MVGMEVRGLVPMGGEVGGVDVHTLEYVTGDGR